MSQANSDHITPTADIAINCTDNTNIACSNDIPPCDNSIPPRQTDEELVETWYEYVDAVRTFHEMGSASEQDEKEFTKKISDYENQIDSIEQKTANGLEIKLRLALAKIVRKRFSSEYYLDVCLDRLSKEQIKEIKDTAEAHFIWDLLSPTIDIARGKCAFISQDNLNRIVQRGIAQDKAAKLHDDIFKISRDLDCAITEMTAGVDALATLADAQSAIGEDISSGAVTWMANKLSDDVRRTAELFRAAIGVESEGAFVR